MGQPSTALQLLLSRCTRTRTSLFCQEDMLYTSQRSNSISSRLRQLGRQMNVFMPNMKWWWGWQWGFFASFSGFRHKLSLESPLLHIFPTIIIIRRSETYCTNSLFVHFRGRWPGVWRIHSAIITFLHCQMPYFHHGSEHVYLNPKYRVKTRMFYSWAILPP